MSNEDEVRGPLAGGSTGSTPGPGDGSAAPSGSPTVVSPATSTADGGTGTAAATGAAAAGTDAGTPGSGARVPAGWTATVVTTERRGVRVGTVVWGLVLAAIGVGLLAWASGVVFDVQLAVILLVAAAGVALLVGSLVGGRRRGR